MLAFNNAPWLAEPFASDVELAYQAQYYSSIANQVGSNYSSPNHFVRSNLTMAFMDEWDLGAEVEFDKTRKKDFGFESIAARFRKQFYNDIAGDPITLTFGVNARVVPRGRLSDPSTPYHDVFNLEGNLTFGKEWSNYYSWTYRTYGFFALGQANQGSPWIRLDYHGLGQINEKWIWDLFLSSYWGTGRTQDVNVPLFKGYYNINHQSIDLGAKISREFGIWGRLNLMVSGRVYARSYPRNAPTFEISYTYPFSFLAR